MQNAASLFATNQLLYEVWDSNTLFFYGKHKEQSIAWLA